MSPAELAARCRMPRSRVSDLLAGKRRITPDTAVRLAALFRMEPESWLALQAPWDLHQTPLDAEVVPLDPPGFLIGPLGATPLSVRRAPRRAVVVVVSTATDHPPEVRQRSMHREVRYVDGTRALVASDE
jgi:addiction module HigA family antidote